MALRRAAFALGRSGLGAVAETSASASASLGGQVASSSGADQIRHASNQAVKQRIRAIKNIGKITKAMKMVAASKMRNAQVAVEGSRGALAPLLRLLGDHPAAATGKDVTVAVTSDRGLCGGLNSNTAKYTRALLGLYGGGRATDAAAAASHGLVVIGDKGRSQLVRTDSERIKMTVADTYKMRVTFAQASLIAEDIVKEGAPDAVRVVFNKFRSAISFKPTVATVLGADALERQLASGGANKLDAYEMETALERSDALRDLSELSLALTLHNAMLENNCSEHASRMSAMENSTKSASEMLGSLTLAYNRKRQASITTELIEIIAGASALVDAD